MFDFQWYLFYNLPIKIMFFRMNKPVCFQVWCLDKSELNTPVGVETTFLYILLKKSCERYLGDKKYLGE